MNINKQPPVVAGVFLIALGLVWWLNLWALLLPGALLAGGVVAYRQRRAMGRMAEGVQAGLWCVGLALLFMLHFVWPGILFVAGASFLARGREGQIDAAVQQLGSRFSSRSAARPASSTPVQQVQISTVYPAPIAPQQSAAPVASADRSATGDTTRL